MQPHSPLNSDPRWIRNLCTTFGLIGRAAVIISVRGKVENQAKLTAKAGWAHSARVRGGKPDERHRIVQRKPTPSKSSPYTTKAIKQISLPRSAMNLISDGRAPPVCRILTLKSYHQLEDIGSAARFRIVSVDVVPGFPAYEHSKSLHCDISTDSVMWYEGPNARPVGVIYDWDRVTEDHSSSIRIDGGLFMAIDLLRVDPPPPHKYRHDLESWFYTYVFAAASYDPPKKRFRKIAQWEQQSLINVWHNKRDLLLERREWVNMLKDAYSDFHALLRNKSFLVKLWQQFEQTELSFLTGIEQMERMRMGDPGRSADEMERMEERDAIMTYSKFMETLGEQEDICHAR